VASCHWGLGEVERLRNHDSDAETHYKAALELFREAGNKSGEASCLWGCAEVERIRNRYSEAKKHYNDALPLFRNAQNKPGEALCLESSGDLCFEVARKRWEEALDIFKFIDNEASAHQVEMKLGRS